MIIAGGISASSVGLSEAPVVGLRFDTEEDLRQLASAVQVHDTAIIAELVPSLGRMARPASGGRIISASPVNVLVAEDRSPQGIKLPGGLVTRTPDEATVWKLNISNRS